MPTVRHFCPIHSQTGLRLFRHVFHSAWLRFLLYGSATELIWNHDVSIVWLQQLDFENRPRQIYTHLWARSLLSLQNLVVFNVPFSKERPYYVGVLRFSWHTFYYHRFLLILTHHVFSSTFALHSTRAIIPCCVHMPWNESAFVFSGGPSILSTTAWKIFSAIQLFFSAIKLPSVPYLAWCVPRFRSSCHCWQDKKRRFLKPGDN